MDVGEARLLRNQVLGATDLARKLGIVLATVGRSRTTGHYDVVPAFPLQEVLDLAGVPDPDAAYQAGFLVSRPSTELRTFAIGSMNVTLS